MKPIKIAGANRSFGGPGYITIDVRRDVVDGQVMLTLALQPDQREINAMIAGAPVYLTILGEGWPPVNINVGEVP